MATTRYATVTELRERIGTAGGSFTAAENALHEDALDSASRVVDRYCRRFFGQSDSGTARVFTARYFDCLTLPDLVSVSAVKTDTTGDGSYDTTWSASDYHLEPKDGASLTGEARPYTKIRVSTLTGTAWNTFPLTQYGVQITGVWGWPAVPDAVRMATILTAMQWLQQEQTPSAVHASAELGRFIVEPELHPAAAMRLRPYRRIGGLGYWGGE